MGMPPNDVQTDSVRALERWAESELPRLWNFERRTEVVKHAGQERYRWRSHPRIWREDDEDGALYETTMEAARALLGHELTKALASYYFLPETRGSLSRVGEAPADLAHSLLLMCANRYLFDNADDYVFGLALQRLQTLLLTPGGGRSFSDASAGPEFAPPAIPELCRWLQHEDFPVARYATKCRDFIEGRWSVPVPEELANGSAYRTSLDEHAHQLSGFAYRVMDQFEKEGELDFEDFRRVTKGRPWKFLQHEYGRRRAWYVLAEAANGPELDEELEQWSFRPTGGRWLVAVCRLIEARGLDRRDMNEQSYAPLSRALIRLVSLEGLAEDENVDELVAQLKTFQPDTLWLIFMFADAGQPVLLKALDAEVLLPLHRWLCEAAESIYNSDYLGSGRVDCAALDRYQRVPEDLFERYVLSIRQSRYAGRSVQRALKLIYAFRGENRDELKKAVRGDEQLDMKAYGLLPIESKDDVRARYLLLKERAKAAKQYNAERQANIRAAVTVGLANLAGRAGFKDATRMEWALEAEIASGAVDFEAPVEIGPWVVQIELTGAVPSVVVHKDGKRLRTVPVKIRKEPAFVEVRTAATRLKEQASRFRKTLEQMMCDGESLSRTDLEQLVTIPAMRCLLHNLIGINEAGDFGLVEPESLELLEDDRRHPIQSSLRIAHAYDLLQAGTLSDWQRRIVEGERVQPFKQAFREVYLLTPAERDARLCSTRFAGRQVDTSVGYRLLQSRGWSFGTVNAETGVYKGFPDFGLEAEWRFPDIHHILGEEPMRTSDQIAFLRESEAVPLEEVPPLLFSEVMRDADLVVSVAAFEDEGESWSTERTQNRRAVIQSVATKLRLKDLRFDDRFVRFDGKLASYRIHLGTAAIYIEPGGHVCIVPEAKKPKKIYLPFVDADKTTTEIITKILLLQNDHKIKDESILVQLRGD